MIFNIYTPLAKIVTGTLFVKLVSPSLWHVIAMTFYSGQDWIILRSIIREATYSMILRKIVPSSVQNALLLSSPIHFQVSYCLSLGLWGTMVHVTYYVKLSIDPFGVH